MVFYEKNNIRFFNTVPECRFSFLPTAVERGAASPTTGAAMLAFLPR